LNFKNFFLTRVIIFYRVIISYRGLVNLKMTVKLRLTRKGAKKKPYYRVVAADSESPRDGRFLDIIGTYDPMKDPAEIKLDKEKVSQWLNKGATPTESVNSIFKKKGLLKVSTTAN